MSCFWTFLLTAAVFSFHMPTAQAATFRRDASLAAVAGESGGTQVDDKALVTRLLGSYNKGKENRGDSLWRIIYDQRHTAMDRIFRKGLVQESADLLRNPGASDLFYGIDNLGHFILEELKKNPLAIQGYAASCLDKMLRLAEAIGALDLDNPETYHYQDPIPWTAHAIVQQIEEALGQSITFPNPYPNEPGVVTSKGIVSERVPQAASK